MRLGEGKGCVLCRNRVKKNWNLWDFTWLFVTLLISLSRIFFHYSLLISSSSEQCPIPQFQFKHFTSKMSHSRQLPPSRPPSTVPSSPLSSWLPYRPASRSHYPSSLSSKDSYVLQSDRRRGSESPLLRLHREFEGFYRKATGSRPASPRGALVNNATFEPLILRTKAESKVAADRALKKPEVVSKLPQTLRLEDLTQAVDLLESSSESDCGQLPRQYTAQLLRLSQAIAGKVHK